MLTERDVWAALACPLLEYLVVPFYTCSSCCWSIYWKFVLFQRTWGHCVAFGTAFGWVQNKCHIAHFGMLSESTESIPGIFQCRFFCLVLDELVPWWISLQHVYWISVLKLKNPIRFLLLQQTAQVDRPNEIQDFILIRFKKLFSNYR